MKTGDRVKIIQVDEADVKCGINISDTGIIKRISGVVDVLLDESYFGIHPCSSMIKEEYGRRVKFRKEQLEINNGS